MATLDAKTIAGVAVNAGFTGNDLVTAVAIALAESSGRTGAHNTNAATGDNSYGLWQINMIGSMGPARRRLFDISKNDELLQPNTNASAAYKLYKAKGSKFGDWSTYNKGTYKSHVAAATKAVKDNGGKAIAMGTVDPSDKADVNIGPVGFDLPKMPDVGGSITGAVNAFGQNLFKMGASFGGIVIAVVLLILGVIILLREPIARGAKVALGVAENVAPGGKVATKVTKLKVQHAANKTATANAATKVVKAQSASDVTRTASQAAAMNAATKIVRAQTSAAKAAKAAAKTAKTVTDGG